MSERESIAFMDGSGTVANFFLIDHSLKDSSGHHFDYVQRVAEAANGMGFLTTIGANRKLRNTPGGEVKSLGCLGSVRRVFRNTTYHPDSYLSGLRHLTRSKFRFELDQTEGGFWNRHQQRISDFQHRRRRERYVRQFAVDCEKFFRNTLFTPNDHAFFTTVSELELMGLAVFLSNQPRTLQTQWHLQFHFNLFAGRPPEYEQQVGLGKAVRSCFLAALSRLSYHAINFYTTSEQLADQYNRLGVGEFETLPYPISDEFSPSRKEQQGERAAPSTLRTIRQQASFELAGTSGFAGTDSVSESAMTICAPPEISFSGSSFNFETPPLKIACAGGVRREKGHHDYLQPLVDEIWEPLLATGKAQLVSAATQKEIVAKGKD